MTIRATYRLRRGGSGGRTIKDAVEAEKILKGGYGVTNVRLLDQHGNTIGLRWRDPGQPHWHWFYDPAAFQ